MATVVARVARGPVDLARRSVAIFISMAGFDRSMALAAQMFTALIPMLIVVAALLEGGDGGSLADALVSRLGLSGATADSVRRVLPPSSSVESAVSGLSVVILVISALSFTRALQRLYESAWGLQPRGLRDTGYGLLWLAGFSGLVAVHLALHGHINGDQGLLSSIAGTFVIWLVTPYVIVARRVPWQVLVPQALITAVCLTIFRATSAIYMPTAISSSADQFGALGVCFALISWLFGAATVLAGSAAVGAAVSGRGREATGV